MKAVCVYVFGKRKKVSIERGFTVGKLLEKLGINPEIVIAIKNREIVPDTEAIKPGDRIEVVKVVSGG